MRTLAILLLAAAALAGCRSGDDLQALDDEYSLFAYEQEKYRREDLEKLYQEERARSDELTEKILRIRKEIEEKERQLRELEKRRDGG